MRLLQRGGGYITQPQSQTQSKSQRKRRCYLESRRIGRKPRVLLELLEQLVRLSCSASVPRSVVDKQERGHSTEEQSIQSERKERITFHLDIAPNVVRDLLVQSLNDHHLRPHLGPGRLQQRLQKRWE